MQYLLNESEYSDVQRDRLILSHLYDYILTNTTYKDDDVVVKINPLKIQEILEIFPRKNVKVEFTSE